MKKSEQAARVKAMCEYLAGIGHPVSNVQGFELLARAHGLKNKHVLAALNSNATGEGVSKVPAEPVIPAFVRMGDKDVPVQPLECTPPTYAEMVAKDWQFDTIIPVPVDKLGSSEIDDFNDYSSTRICGNDAALEDIRYTHVPSVTYGEGLVAYRVCAYVSAPEDWFPEAEAAADAAFYGDLLELSEAIAPGARFVLQSDNNPAQEREGVITYIALLAETAGTAAGDLLREYAISRGGNNDRVNQAAAEVVFDLTSLSDREHLLGRFTLGTLKYATKVAPRTWAINDKDKRLVRLQVL